VDPARTTARRGARDGGDAVVRDETGGQSDQESRRTGHRAATGPTAKEITSPASVLPQNDPDVSLTCCRDTSAFCRRTRGVGVRHDVGHTGMHWITLGPADQPGTSIVLEPSAPDPVGCRLVVPTVGFAPRRSS
jgi:hypothetical protein